MEPTAGGGCATLGRSGVLVEGFQEEFLRWVGDRIRLHRTDDTEPDRRAETVLWDAALIIRDCDSANQAAAVLRMTGKYSRGVERTYWFALAGLLEELATQRLRQVVAPQER